MAKTIVTLQPAGSHVTFSATLGARYRFELNWLTSYGYYVVTVYDDAGRRLIAGKSLHIGVNIMSRHVGFEGSLKLEGQPPTPYNLGKENQLVWER